MASKHDRLMQEHHLILQSIYPESRYFRRDTGIYYLPNGTPIRIGIPGMADSWGIIKIKEFLIHVEFEYKIGKDIQSKEQKAWEQNIVSLGGIYQVVKDEPHTSIEILKARIKELTECLNTF